MFSFFFSAPQPLTSSTLLFRTVWKDVIEEGATSSTEARYMASAALRRTTLQEDRATLAYIPRKKNPVCRAEPNTHTNTRST